MATYSDKYTQTVPGTAPVGPSETSVLDMKIMGPLIRQIWQTRIIDEPRISWDVTSAHSFFTGESMIDWGELLRNLRYGQEIIVPIKKDQNPFNLYQSTAINYGAVGENCARQIEIPCEVPCISTEPSYETLRFAFDTMYAYGVRACVVTEDFYPYEWYQDQYGLSREAMKFGQEIDLWNKVIKGLIAAPATTIDVNYSTAHPTHYWNNLGAFSVNTIDLLRSAGNYFVNAYDVNPSMIMTPEMGRSIIAAVQTQWNFNANWQRVNTFQQYDVPGMLIDEQVREIIGLDMYVLFLKRSNWLTWTTTATGGGTQTATRYPLWSQDLTKEYVAILDPRVGYSIVKPGTHLDIMPYDCDKMIKGMIDTEFMGSGITFPQYGMILEFNRIPAVTT